MRILMRKGIEEFGRFVVGAISFSSNRRSNNLDAIIFGTIINAIFDQIYCPIRNGCSRKDHGIIVVINFISFIVGTLEGLGGLFEPRIDIPNGLPGVIAFGSLELFLLFSSFAFGFALANAETDKPQIV